MKKLIMTMIILGLVANGGYVDAYQVEKRNTLKLPIQVINVVERRSEIEQRYDYHVQLFTKQALENFKKQVDSSQNVVERSIIIEQALGNAGYKTQFAQLYKQASDKYGVPWQVIAAVHIVETRQSGTTNITSYAGATGPMQFLPSTFRAYAQDGDGNGIAEINNIYDAVYSGANYLRANGAASGLVPNALYRYNHSNAYVNHVLSIAKNLGY